MTEKPLTLEIERSDLSWLLGVASAAKLASKEAKVRLFKLHGKLQSEEEFNIQTTLKAEQQKVEAYRKLLEEVFYNISLLNPDGAFGDLGYSFKQIDNLKSRIKKAQTKMQEIEDEV